MAATNCGGLARVAVHFTAVCERFSPYDTIFEIATASELRDTKLSAACSLHAASGSTASSTSSRRRRLMEIAEEDEEEQRSPKRQSVVQQGDDDRPRTPGSRSTTAAAEEVRLNSELASSPEHSKFSAATTVEIPKFTGVPDAPASPTRSVETSDSRSDLYSYYPTGKPKVKLAPRPKADLVITQQTAGNFRPVSSLPAGIKLFGKGNKKGKGKDGDAASLIHEEIPEVQVPTDTTSLHTPEVSLGIRDAISRPSTSTGIPADTLSVPAVPTKPTMTPEKARLMKAMKLREKKKKQLLLKQQQSPLAEEAASSSVADASGAEVKMVLRGGQDFDHAANPAMESHDEEEDDDDDDDDEEEAEEEEEEEEAGEENRKSLGAEDQVVSISQADSGVALDSLSSSAQIEPVSQSRAQSPAVTTSEHDESTAASSLSDSTDDTVQAKKEDEAGDVTSRVDTAQQQQVAAAEIDATSSSSLEEKNANQTKETSIAMQSTENATGANKGSAKAENEKEKKGSVVPISKFSANIPTSKAPPAAALSGMGSGAAEIPLITPGDVAQATDKGELEASPLPSARRSHESSTHDLVAQSTVVATTTTPLMERQTTDPSQQHKAAAVDTKRASGETTAAAPDEPKPKQDASSSSRRSVHLPRPIQTDLTAPEQQPKAARDNNNDDDDGLAKEDQEKTHDAAAAAAQSDNKPLVATKSPLTPVFPSAAIANGPLGARAPQAHTVRTVSNPVRGNFIAPTDVTQSTARSLSSGAAFLHKVTQQQSASLATMKPNVGSSISQRIKALEKLSATSGDQSRPVSRERPSSTFFAVQKRDSSRPPSVMDRTKSLKGRAASPTPSQDDFYPPLEAGRVRLQRSGSVVSRVSMFEPLAASASASASNNASSSSGGGGGGLAPGPQSRGRPESVAVTTRIARDPSQLSAASSSDYYGYQQQQLLPPLMGDHHRDEGSSERRSRSLERDGEDDMGRRSSLNAVKGFFKDPRKSVTVSTNMRHAIVSRTTTQSPSSHRLSMSSRRSITLDRDGLANSSVTEDSFSSDERADKKTSSSSSRAGRFMRKLSSLSSGSKGNKTASSPVETTAGQNAGLGRPPVASPAPAASSSSPADASIVSDLGDVNVQFPDSLLWKRRNLCLDSQGCIILSALPAQSSRTAVGTKRYHMGEFRPPYTPDVDMQELPNSVALDFVEGTGIQLACEDRTGQLNVLHGGCEYVQTGFIG